MELPGGRRESMRRKKKRRTHNLVYSSNIITSTCHLPQPPSFLIHVIIQPSSSVESLDENKTKTVCTRRPERAREEKKRAREGERGKSGCFILAGPLLLDSVESGLSRQLRQVDRTSAGNDCVCRGTGWGWGGVGSNKRRERRKKKWMHVLTRECLLAPPPPPTSTPFVSPLVQAQLLHGPRPFPSPVARRCLHGN